MNILITGGAGFIGSHLADTLKGLGHSVYIVDNLATGSKDNILDFVAEGRFFEADIKDFASLLSIFESIHPDIVVHAAASYKDPNNWESDVLTNCLGGAYLAKLCASFKVERVIYFQTSCAYGHSPAELPVKPEHLLNPDNSSYAITKATAEFFLKISGVDYISFRLANCYGPRTKTGPVPNFYKKLVAGETCTVMNTRRDYIYIDDLCAVVVRAINGEGRSGAYHISTGKDYAIADLYQTMSNLLGIQRDAEYKERGDDDTATLLIDPTKTETEFPGWKASTPLEEGLAETIAYYKSNPPDAVYTHLRMKK